MKMSLENDIGARKLDNDKSARHFTSFQIKANYTIRQPVYSQQYFQNFISNCGRMHN